MSIAIVSNFLKPQLAGPSPDSVAANPAATDAASGGPDFASLLRALPAKGNEAVLGKDAAADRHTAFAEGNPPADSQFLAVLDPGQRTLANLSPLPERPQAGETDPASLSVVTPARKDQAVASAGAATPADSLDLKDQASDARWSSATQSLGADDKAAKFAVAATAGQAFGRVEAKTPEQTPPASSLATLAAAPHAHTVATAPLDVPQSLQTPLRDPSWAGDFGQKLLWFASNDKQLAQLTLNPPQLGSVEVTLRIDKDSANAHFVSANADVRGAIETALPRLREMFASAGIELGQVSVGSESFRPPGEGQQQPARPPLLVADGTILANDFASGFLAQPIATHHGSALIDIFA